jgi:hypothetical protein
MPSRQRDVKADSTLNGRDGTRYLVLTTPKECAELKDLLARLERVEGNWEKAQQ